MCDSLQYMLHFPNPGKKIMLIGVYTVEKEEGCNKEVAGVGLKMVKNIHTDKCEHINMWCWLE